MKMSVIFLLVFLCIGCSTSKTLTRDKAKDLLQVEFKQNPKPGPDTIKLTDAETKELISKHLIENHQYTPTINTLEILPEGRKYFSNILVIPNGWEVVTAMNNRGHVVEVTGISDDPENPSGNEKIVDFTWTNNWGELPPAIAGVFKNHHPETSKARLRLYDDGWRVVTDSAAE